MTQPKPSITSSYQIPNPLQNKNIRPPCPKQSWSRKNRSAPLQHNKCTIQGPACGYLNNLSTNTDSEPEPTTLDRFTKSDGSIFSLFPCCTSDILALRLNRWLCLYLLFLIALAHTISRTWRARIAVPSGDFGGCCV